MTVTVEARVRQLVSTPTSRLGKGAPPDADTDVPARVGVDHAMQRESHHSIVMGMERARAFSQNRSERVDRRATVNGAELR